MGTWMQEKNIDNASRRRGETERERQTILHAGTVLRRGQKNREPDTGEGEKLAVLTSSALTRHPGSSALQLFTSVLT